MSDSSVHFDSKTRPSGRVFRRRRICLRRSPGSQPLSLARCPPVTSESVTEQREKAASSYFSPRVESGGPGAPRRTTLSRTVRRHGGRKSLRTLGSTSRYRPPPFKRPLRSSFVSVFLLPGFWSPLASLLRDPVQHPVRLQLGLSRPPSSSSAMSTRPDMRQLPHAPASASGVASHGPGGPSGANPHHALYRLPHMGQR